MQLSESSAPRGVADVCSVHRPAHTATLLSLKLESTQLVSIRQESSPLVSPGHRHSAVCPEGPTARRAQLKASVLLCYHSEDVFIEHLPWSHPARKKCLPQLKEAQRGQTSLKASSWGLQEGTSAGSGGKGREKPTKKWKFYRHWRSTTKKQLSFSDNLFTACSHKPSSGTNLFEIL